MNALEFFREAEKRGISREYVIRVCALLLDTFHELRLGDNRSLWTGDVPSVLEFLREVVENETAHRCAPTLQLRQEQTRYQVSDTCIRCSHVHQDGDKCGVDMGRGGICECTA